MCIRGIDSVSFWEFSFEFRSCSDRLVLFSFYPFTIVFYERNRFLHSIKIKDRDIFHSRNIFCLFYPRFASVDFGQDRMSYTCRKYPRSSLQTRFITCQFDVHLFIISDYYIIYDQYCFYCKQVEWYAFAGEEKTVQF